MQHHVATLIGDVISSRDDSDREELQRRLRQAFDAVNDLVPSLQPLMMTIGDEFQAVYETLAAALEAHFRLAIEMYGRATIRVGLGWGAIRVFERERLPLEQDGEAWWHARDALATIESAEQRYGMPAGWRTAVITGADDTLLNGYLVLRDHILAGIDLTDVAIIRGLLAGETLTGIAHSLGLNKSSVSRRASSHGLTALLSSRPAVVPTSTVPSERS